MKLLCYSDVHHGAYSNGLILADTLSIEDQVFDLAQGHDVDAVINCGDRFASRNPPSSVRIAADLKIQRIAAEFPIVLLIGNHCREAKNANSAHSSLYLTEMCDVNNLLICDTAGQVCHPKLPDVIFDVIPAGQMGQYQFGNDSRAYRICLFHDIIKGSHLSGGMRADHGVEPITLDRKEFTVAIGGDNHTPQDLNFKNTTGFYCGAALQHCWGDTGQDRGFVLVEFSGGDVKYTRIPSKSPKFICLSVDIQSKDDIKKLESDSDVTCDEIVRLKLTGDLKLLNSINTEKLEKKMLIKNQSRAFKIIVEPTIAFKALVPALQNSKTPADNWTIYIESGHADSTGCDIERIKSMGNEILAEVTTHA